MIFITRMIISFVVVAMFHTIDAQMVHAELITPKLIDQYAKTPEDRGIMMDTIEGSTFGGRVVYITVGKVNGKVFMEPSGSNFTWLNIKPESCVIFCGLLIFGQ